MLFSRPLTVVLEDFLRATARKMLRPKKPQNKCDFGLLRTLEE